MRTKKKKAIRPFPGEILVLRNAAGTDDEYYGATETREDAADFRDGEDERIAVYQLVKVLLPETKTVFTEVNNDEGE
jgi:hypothetical protein